MFVDCPLYARHSIEPEGTAVSEAKKAFTHADLHSTGRRQTHTSNSGICCMVRKTMKMQGEWRRVRVGERLFHGGVRESLSGWVTSELKAECKILQNLDGKVQRP